MSDFSLEPAFRWNETSFCYYCPSPARRWYRGNDSTKFANLETGEEELLQLLIGDATDYASFASDYFETKVSVDLVNKIFAHESINDQIVAAINPKHALAEISDELFFTIGYPHLQ